MGEVVWCPVRHGKADPQGPTGYAVLLSRHGLGATMSRRYGSGAVPVSAPLDHGHVHVGQAIEPSFAARQSSPDPDDDSGTEALAEQALGGLP